MSANAEIKSSATTSNSSVPLSQPWQQLQIMSIGIPGSGKTTVGKILAKLFAGGKYVDQDMYAMSSKNYHNAVKEFSSDPAIKMLYMGKGHHKTQVRKGAFDALDTLNATNTSNKILVGLYFQHPLDVLAPPFGTEVKDVKEIKLTSAPSVQLSKNINLLALSMERINKRGHGHSCLYPGDKLAGILSGFANELQPPTEDEIEKFTDVIRMDVTLDKLSMVKYVLTELKSSGLLDDYKVETSDEAILVAIESVAAEEKLLELQMSTKTQTKPKNENKSKVAVDPSLPKPTLFWGIAPSKEDWTNILATSQVQAALADVRPAPIKPYPHAHSTMEFIGGIKAPPPGTEGYKDEKKMYELEGKEIKLTIKEVVWDNLAIALALEKDFPCQNAIAHVTVGVAPKIQPFYSNTLLAKPPTETKRLAFDPPLVITGHVKRFL